MAISDVTKEPAHEIMIRINLDKKSQLNQAESTQLDDEKE